LAIPAPLIKTKKKFMKSLRFPLLGIMVMMLAVSCKKEDLTDTVQPKIESTTASAGADSSAWKSFSTWNAIEREKFNVYYTSVNDANLTASTVEDGLVLVYMKNNANGAVTRLPLEEKIGADTYYWYYQVAEGNILISCDVNGTAKDFNEKNSFRYEITTKDALTNLEQKGVSKTDLMKMTYNELVSTKNAKN